MINKGFIIALTRPITTAAKRAILKPVIVMPGTTQAIKISDAAYKTHLINSSTSFLHYLIQINIGHIKQKFIPFLY